MRATTSGATIRVVFVDPGHGPRAQMAEALLSARAGDTVDVASAGSEPGESVELVAEVLERVGITDFVPKRRTLADAAEQPPDLLVPVCEEDCQRCPFVPGARRVERWPFDDPAPLPTAERFDALALIRDGLQARIERLVSELQASG